MINKIALFCLIPLFLAAQVMGAIVNGVPEDALRYVYGHYAFYGDRHGDFVGDYVVVLNDGSEWKVHPEDSNVFSQWEINDIVHPRVRTSHYWFKREHKFELFNHTRKQTVKVMLVRYPTNPLRVTDVTVELTKIIITKRPWVINHYTYHAHLNDGTTWQFDSNVGNLLTVGKFLYLGVNDTAEGYTYFFILGSEREATWIGQKK